MWYGWLLAKQGDERLLKQLGVKIVHTTVEKGGGLDLLVEVKKLDKLNPYWGRFCWGLKER